MIEDIGLPANVDTERLVLGSLIACEELAHVARPILSDDDFSTEQHRRIWRVIAALYDKGTRVDRVTLANALMARKELESVGGLSYLVSLDEGLPRLPDLGAYTKILRDDTLRRRIILTGRDIIARAAERGSNPQELLDSMVRAASEIVPADSGGGLISAAELLARVGVEAILAPRVKRGMSLPWPWMYQHTAGWLPGELWVLAGHTSTGKSSAAIQAGVHIAGKGHGAAIFSLEMGDVSVYQRALWQVSGVDSERAKQDKLTPEELERVREALMWMNEQPLYLDDKSLSLVQIHAALRRQQSKRKVGLVVIDYLQLLEDAGRHGSRAEAVGANARKCKQMATEFGVTVLLLSQFNRESAKPGKDGAQRRKPELSDLKESGDIENHANGVWFIHRENMQDMETVPVEFILAKQREGRRNIYTDRILFRTRFQRFEDTSGMGQQ